METKKTVFEKLSSINVNEKTEKKSNLTYLSWAWAWAEVKKTCPDATYIIKETEYDEALGFMCHSTVTIEGETLEMWLPVMDGANKSMKKVAYKYSTKYGDKTVEAATTFDINKTLMRCLTKNLAMFGLGLYIYAGEDLPEDTKEKPITAPKDLPVVPKGPLDERKAKALGTLRGLKTIDTVPLLLAAIREFRGTKEGVDVVDSPTIDKFIELNTIDVINSFYKFAK
jgi:hypothetical protein